MVLLQLNYLLQLINYLALFWHSPQNFVTIYYYCIKTKLINYLLLYYSQIDSLFINVLLSN